ncbi:MAG: GspH/FimT family pseudopilin [Rhodocyclaceae bacterium]|nr:GspH/FimT family pseudopilin [Rhodocyclaceae bacterium]MBX3669432.1 GspH/FimT family pseudopilin [Rhodocyclaceae bacterium]
MLLIPKVGFLKRLRVQRGVSTVELVLGLAAFAAAATAGIHALARSNATAAVRAQASVLQSALNFARNEAIRLQASVDVVPLDEDWTRGWNIRVHGAEAPMREYGPLGDDIAPIHGRAVSFLRTGLVRGDGAPTESLHVASRSNPARLFCVEFRVTGLPVLRADKDADGGCDAD